MPKTILVVDDDLAIRLLLAEVLAEEGYRVETAADGHLALTMLAHQLPDLLIVDMFMPHLSGGEVIRSLQQRGLSLPILVFTASGAARQEAVALVGEACCLSKPFELAALLDQIARLLADQRQGAAR